MRSPRVRVTTDVVGPRARVAAILVVAAIGVTVAGLKTVVDWSGDRVEYLMFAGANLFLATLATVFFNTRWRILGNDFDRHLQTVFLPIACHFAFLVTIELLPVQPGIRVPALNLSWIFSQTVAAVLLLYTVRRGTTFDPHARTQRVVGAIIVSSVVWAAFSWLRSTRILVAASPIEIGLATLFVFAGTTPLLGEKGHLERREVWLGAGFLVAAIAHLEMSFSSQQLDNPFMWGLVLLALSLTAPIVGAVLENVNLLESQTALSDRLTRLRRRNEIVLDALPVLVLSVDGNRNLRFANRTANSLFGVPKGISDGSVGSVWTDGIHPHDRPRVYAAITGVLESGPQYWEDVVRTEDAKGEVHWINMQMHPVEDPLAGETLVQVVGADVTDLQFARKSAEARQSRLAFLSNLAQAVAGEVEDQKILEQFMKMGTEIFPIRSLLLYRPLADSSGLRLVAGTGPGVEYFDDERIHPIRAGEHPCWLAFRGGSPYAATTAAALPPSKATELVINHEIRYLSYLPAMAAGRTVGVLVITSSSRFELASEDIDLLTQVGFLLGGAVFLAQLVRELDEQRAVAFEASRLKSEFLANTSHELRTPLTAILGFLRLIIDGAVKDEGKQHEFLSIAHESAEKLLTIINDVLDLAKIEAGRLEVHHAPVSLRTVLSDVEALFQHQMRSKGINFTIDPTHAGLVLWADPDRTLQILTNLLSNSMKFTPRGGSISISCTPKGRDVTVAVADTGAGIPKDELNKIFSSFYQVDGSTTREHGGTGLGLTISRRLAELMGGTLQLRSDGIDRGTTAYLHLRQYEGEEIPTEMP